MASRGVISAPLARPATLSLLNAADTPPAEDSAQRWELGYSYAPDACSDAWVENPCDISARTSPARPAVVEVEPFNVVAGDKCSSFGFEAADYEGRARRLLDRCASKQIAKELWKGTLAQAEGFPNRFLASPTSDTVTNGPTAVVDVLACLEQALAQCGCGEQGMIHATYQLVTHWAALGSNVITREGGILRTIHGTLVVVDAGYDGSNPAGTVDPDSTWAYATGLVTVRRGPVTVTPGSFEEGRAEALDRSLNDFEFFAEQPATATWNGCCHFAAQADLQSCLIGGVS